MTLYHVYANDAYEIIVRNRTIAAIIVHSGKRTTIGEMVEIDDLPAQLQEEITEKVRKFASQEPIL